MPVHLTDQICRYLPKSTAIWDLDDGQNYFVLSDFNQSLLLVRVSSLDSFQSSVSGSIQECNKFALADLTRLGDHSCWREGPFWILFGLQSTA